LDDLSPLYSVFGGEGRSLPLGAALELFGVRTTSKDEEHGQEQALLATSPLFA
jgi:hypothetical protein